MSTDQSVQRDERTVAVENAGYKSAYIFIAFSLLVDVMVRGLLYHEAAWDLLALVVIGGVVCMAFQLRQRTLARGWLKAAILLTIFGAISGIIAVVILKVVKGM